MSERVGFITRVQSFSASHRLHRYSSLLPISTEKRTGSELVLVRGWFNLRTRAEPVCFSPRERRRYVTVHVARNARKYIALGLSLTRVPRKL